MIIADVAVARGVVIDRPLPERASGGDTLVDHVVALIPSIDIVALNRRGKLYVSPTIMTDKIN